MTVKKQLTWTDIKVRDYVKRPDGKNIQFDIKATAQTGEILLVEIKRRKKPIGTTEIDGFLGKIAGFTTAHPEAVVWGACLSLGGFTQNALKKCGDHHIGTATRINYHQKEWSF
jgi:hypothetical protein